MAAEISINDPYLPVYASVSQTNDATGFASPADDITTDADCYLLEIDVVLPVGETVTIQREMAAGNVAPFLAGIPSGRYAVGENVPLFRGDTLQIISTAPVLGDREVRVCASRRGA